MNDPLKLSRWAVCSLALGISSFAAFILIPAAMVTGLIAISKIRQSSGSLKGTPLAALAILTSVIALIFAGLVFVNGQFSCRSFRIPTDSMSPAIKSKEHIVVDWAAYKTKDPARGDIIVYELLGNDKRRLMCKRIVGLPGEDVEIRSGKAYINGAPAEIPGLQRGTLYLNSGEFGKAGQSVKVPDGSYYLLGDNPPESFDSRQHGPVDRRDIKGKYLFAYKGLGSLGHK